MIISNENAKGGNKKNSANTENISNDLLSDTHFLELLAKPVENLFTAKIQLEKRGVERSVGALCFGYCSWQWNIQHIFVI